ncbi:lipopolysaccharide transport periplasmic protein LptA [Microbulbifer sp. 2201CG32-9]|uniref:lipopolysaccharide transport periplasmic protein LptA n=1 Tax=unclassified Microbulbifer TaxID=2619833 RepID=UPI00345C0C2E
MKAISYLVPALCAALPMLSGPALALPEDREQPVRILAHNLDADGGTNLTIYSGDVVITQGSLQIHADRVEAHLSEGGKIRRVIAVGKPARFQQQMAQSTVPVKARAQRIEYTVKTAELLLTGSAHVDRDGNTLAAERIDYDLNSEQMQAKGQSDGGRVEMIWKPETQNNGQSTDDTAQSQ